MDDLDKMARELLAAECTDRAASLEKSAASDRETGDSIQEAIDSGAGITPDDPQDVAAWLLSDAERAEATADLLRRAAAALLTAPPGYVLVPVEPTPEMLRAALRAPCSGHPETGGQSYHNIYRAMIAAAPNRVEP